ncbi:glycosyltransferase [Chryseobacterium sp. WG23]|uniref:glycosyltransferase n=1 Tax=Chryseobacterium sp. WG23 TaxID=2926910 RepID=UPI00211DB808|nr:glycosyltransferase [Chryseobacterium sp. WG23]MCQ9637249.1 glycosyltransferase [Chryseobacterium sp. WG23]
MLYISVVTFNTNINDLSKLFDSFIKIKTDFRVIIIDNSKSDSLKIFFKEFDFVDYIHNPLNPGFGASHNIAITKSINDNIKYHFIVNPDVYFEEDAVTKMVDFVKNHSDIGMMMPQILNLDGTVQNLPKLLPSPFSVLLRKLRKPNFIYEPFINKYELRQVDKNTIYEAPILSGCFTLLNIEAIEDVGMYDDVFFMYFEDWDLSRRVHTKFKTIYYPLTAVYHGYESGANKNKHLFKIFVKSCIYYFNKWGWFFDKERRKINDKTLKQFK